MAAQSLTYIDSFNTEVRSIVENFVKLMQSSKAKFSFSCKPVNSAVFLSFKLYKSWGSEIPLFRTTFRIERKKDLIFLDNFLNGILADWKFYDAEDFSSDQEGNTESDDSEDFNVTNQLTDSGPDLDRTGDSHVNDDNENQHYNEGDSQENGQRLIFDDSD